MILLIVIYVLIAALGVGAIILLIKFWKNKSSFLFLTMVVLAGLVVLATAFTCVFRSIDFSQRQYANNYREFIEKSGSPTEIEIKGVKQDGRAFRFNSYNNSDYLFFYAPIEDAVSENEEFLIRYEYESGSSHIYADSSIINSQMINDGTNLVENREFEISYSSNFIEEDAINQYKKRANELLHQLIEEIIYIGKDYYSTTSLPQIWDNKGGFDVREHGLFPNYKFTNEM